MSKYKTSGVANPSARTTDWNKGNPSMQDQDSDTVSNKKVVKATAHNPEMNFDGGLKTKFGK